MNSEETPGETATITECERGKGRHRQSHKDRESDRDRESHRDRDNEGNQGRGEERIGF